MDWVYLLEAKPADLAGVTTTLRYSQSEVPHPLYNGFHWPARIKTIFNQQIDAFVSRSSGTSTDEQLFGASMPSLGNIEILVGEGDQDVLMSKTWDGRDLTIYRGRPTDPWSAFTLIARLTAADVSWNEDVFTIYVRDFSEVLNVPMQDTLYLGTGTYEGGADLTGVVKPLLFGRCEIVEPIVVDRPNQVYQVHDGPITAASWGRQHSWSTTAERVSIFMAIFPLSVSPPSMPGHRSRGNTSRIKVGASFAWAHRQPG